MDLDENGREQTNHPDEGPPVAIFSPSPLFTITIEDSEGPAPEVHFHPGGQGVWVARMVRRLGGRPRLCGPFGGEAGRIVLTMLEGEEIGVRPTQSGSPNGGYVHDRRNGERESLADIPSPTLTRHEIDDLYNATLAAGLEAGVAVLTGAPSADVIPPATFGRLAHDLGSNEVKVIADITREELVELKDGVYFLKVSHEDLIRDGLAKGDSIEELYAAMTAFRSQGMANIVVSRAAEPALALINDQLVEVHAPRFEPLDHRGAGDSMTAGIATGTALGLGTEECLRLGAAAGALNVTRHGLGSGDRESIAGVAERVELRALAI